MAGKDRARLARFFPLNNRICQQLRRFFRFTKEKYIDIVCQWFGIIGTRAAGRNQRHIVSPVLGKYRNTCQVKHIQNIGKAHFVLQCKSYHVKFSNRRFGFQRKKRVPLFSHQFFHIRPWRIDTFSRYILPFIQKCI